MSPSLHVNRFVVALLPVLLIFGCSASFEWKNPRAQPDIDPNPAPRLAQNESAQPAATTLPAGELNLTDAPPIDTIIRGTHAQQIEMVRMLQPVDGSAIYFGHALKAGASERTMRTTPIIATRAADRWRAIEIGDERAGDATWAYVGAGPVRGHAWGVLESSTDNANVPAYLLLVHSTDSGASWRTIGLLKPSASARFDSICISPYRGRLSVYQPPGESAARMGFYHYHTNDQGATWSTATFEPDGLTPADPVSDIDQMRFRRDPPARAVQAK